MQYKKCVEFRIKLLTMIIVDVILLALNGGQVIFRFNISRCLCADIVLLVDVILQSGYRNIFQIIGRNILIARFIGQ